MEEDNKRLLGDISRLETLLADSAPTAFETYRRTERGGSAGMSRDPRHRPSRPPPLTDTSSPPGAFLFGDGMTPGAYIGAIFPRSR